MMKKRVNKTKDELVEQMKREAKTEHQKQLVKLMWPLIENLESIYDAQTTCNALSGFIKYGIETKEAELKVQDLQIDLTKEEDSAIKTAVVNLLGLVEQESAKDTASLLEKVGTALAQYGAAQYLKNPMSSMKVTDIVAQ